MVDKSDQSLSPQEIDRLFIQGDRNLHQGNFTAAVDIFEKLSVAVISSHQQYFNIQRNLAKAYSQNNQTEQAIALCQTMVASDSNLISLWGTNFMATLAPQIHQEIIQKQDNQEVVKPTIKSLTIKQKNLAEFKQYCQDNLLGSLRELEKNRIQTLSTIVVSGIICLFITWVICQIILNFVKGEDNIVFYLTFLSLILPIWIIFCRGCIHVYGLNFKRNIIEKIVNFIGEDGKLSYANKLFLEDKRQTILGFTNSQLFRDELQEPDSLEQEDCVYGTIGNTDIFFAEIFVKNVRGGHLNELEMKDSFGESMLFHGLFFQAKFSKNFVSRTFVLPNDLKNKILLKNNWQGEIVSLEDPEFQKIFQVYGDNQIESRYVLSTSLMSRLVEFNQKAKRKVYLSFIDGFVYIAIPYRYRLFQPKLLKNMTSFAPLREYFLDLQLMIGIVNDLNLNRRIWG